jgi:CubicO group peptidase (beta-lactamase class C family)
VALPSSSREAPCISPVACSVRENYARCDSRAANGVGTAEAPCRSRSLRGSVVVVRDGRIVAEQHGGYANREQQTLIGAGTRFYVASVTKSFTATAILLLRDEGKLSLDDPISKFMPDFPHSNITIRQLLTHKSGLQHPVYYPDYFDLAKRSYTTAEAAALFQDRPVLKAPGAQRQYSDYNYVLLARIIEVASGNAYGQFLTEHIFRPQHFSSAGNHASWEQIVANRAAGYQPVGMNDFENARYFDYSIATGAASIYMSAEDLAHWIEAIGLDSVLSPQSTDELLGTSDHAGLLQSRDIAGHRAIALNGWDNIGFGADALYFPDSHFAIAVTSNQNDSGIAPYLTEAIAQSVLTKKQVEPPQFSEKVTNPQRFAGKYRLGSDFYVPGQELEIVVRNDELFELQKNPERLMGLIPMSDGSFMYRSHWARVTFQQENGRVVALTFDAFKATKIP